MREQLTRSVIIKFICGMLDCLETETFYYSNLFSLGCFAREMKLASGFGETYEVVDMRLVPSQHLSVGKSNLPEN